MTTVRTHIRLVLAILLVAAAATAVLLWLLGPFGNDGGARAFSPVVDICRDQTAYHQVKSTKEAYTNSHGYDLHWTEKASFSDGNYHSFNYSADGVAKSERILVGNYHYARMVQDDGTWGEWNVQEMWSPDDFTTTDDQTGSPTPGDIEDGDGEGSTGRVDDDEGTVFCGLRNLLDLTFEGHTKVDGVAVRHYTATSDMDYVFDEDLAEINVEFWVDQEGEVIKYYEELLGVEEEGYDQYIYRETITWYDHGKPNVITAPLIP